MSTKRNRRPVGPSARPAKSTRKPVEKVKRKAAKRPAVTSVLAGLLVALGVKLGVPPWALQPEVVDGVAVVVWAGVTFAVRVAVRAFADRRLEDVAEELDPVAEETAHPPNAL